MCVAHALLILYKKSNLKSQQKRNILQKCKERFYIIFGHSDLMKMAHSFIFLVFGPIWLDFMDLSCERIIKKRGYLEGSHNSTIVQDDNLQNLGTTLPLIFAYPFSFSSKFSFFLPFAKCDSILTLHSNFKWNPRTIGDAQWPLCP